MKFIEASGKTVKDAIERGVAELGCAREDVNIQVLEMGSPGLFGMFGKLAKVRLTVKESDLGMDIEMPVFSLDQSSGKRRDEGRKKEKAKSEKKPVEAAEAAEQETDEKPEADTAPAERKKRRRSRKPKTVVTEGEATEETVVEAAPVQAEPFVETPEGQLTDTAKSARDFLKGLTEKMGVPAEIAVGESEEQLRMVLSGESMSILIGRRGETLDALQYLTSLHVNHNREEYLRVSLDTENYRAKREEALRKLALRMAGRCKKSGRRVALEPMNPYERRILHSALQADPEVSTHSEGEEPYRRVIITLK